MPAVKRTWKPQSTRRTSMAYAAPHTMTIAPPDEPIPYGGPVLDGTELQRISQRSDLRGATQLGAHTACIAATTLLVWVALPFWYLLVPAMVVHGVTIVTLFAPMHECVHRTAFASRTANEIVAWIAGVLSFYNATFFWHFPSCHHRHPQAPDPAPELMSPKAASRLEYLRE